MAKGYQVLKIDSFVQVGDMNQVVKYYRYTFKTAEGTVDNIVLSEKQATPEKVAEAITKKAQELDAILKGG